MPKAALEISVQPDVLVWARQSLGVGIPKVSRRLDVDEGTIQRWESGQSSPTLRQARELSRVYKRPLAAFFLPRPPWEPPLPTDFRTLPRETPRPLSTQVRLVIRQCRRFQALAVELAGSIDRSIETKIGRVAISDDPEIVATEAREHLGVSVQKQFEWKSDAIAFDEWKRAVEAAGALVFEMGMPIEEVRAFSLTEGGPLAVVLNTRDSRRGNIFSLFHEYAHLLLNDGGLCDLSEQEHVSNDARSVEKFCNHFAGAFLVPRDALRNHALVSDALGLKDWSDKDLESISDDFKVSQEVVLRRLLVLGLADHSFYKMKHDEWTAKARELQTRKKWKRRPSPPKKAVKERGIPLASLILEAHNRQKITRRDVADYLGVRVEHIPGVIEIVGGGL